MSRSSAPEAMVVPEEPVVPEGPAATAAPAEKKQTALVKACGPGAGGGMRATADLEETAQPEGPAAQARPSPSRSKPVPARSECRPRIAQAVSEGAAVLAVRAVVAGSPGGFREHRGRWGRA